MDLVVGDDACRLLLIVATCVQIAVEAGKVAAADFETNSVAFEEDVAGGPEVDHELVHLAGA